MKTYTRLTLEIGFQDGVEQKVTCEENAWDVPPERLVDMLRSLLFAASYSEDVINEYIIPKP